MGTKTNKERYSDFCKKAYVPIYSQPWWMDAVCGEGNWDVWLYESGGEVLAAMPYYLEEREHGMYITKAPLTQNNGIVFRYPAGQGQVSRAKFEEKVIRAAMSYVDSLNLAVYEQQYQPSFTNWLPFSWLGCTALPRYTYCIEDTSDLNKVWGALTSSYRKNIKKGNRNCVIIEQDDPALFFHEHAKVFQRQGLEPPFSEGLWYRLYNATSKHSCCKMLAALHDESIASLLFLVWDSRRMYHLLGGTIPGFNGLETYNALTWAGITLASKLGLAYDFEGSMIERISKSFREFGGVPELYFRVRKVYSPEVVRMEAEQKAERLKEGL